VSKPISTNIHIGLKIGGRPVVAFFILKYDFT